MAVLAIAVALLLLGEVAGMQCTNSSSCPSEAPLCCKDTSAIGMYSRAKCMATCPCGHRTADSCGGGNCVRVPNVWNSCFDNTVPCEERSYDSWTYSICDLSPSCALFPDGQGQCYNTTRAVNCGGDHPLLCTKPQMCCGTGFSADWDKCFSPTDGETCCTGARHSAVCAKGLSCCNYGANANCYDSTQQCCRPQSGQVYNWICPKEKKCGASYNACV
eukprot:Sspe_Gene.100296::Locus_75014_Transcript_1_1_Confidence_1.000_Length_1168::g.100296::m.100296